MSLVAARRLFALAAIPFAVSAFAACASSEADPDGDSDDEVAEQGVSTCRLGNGCTSLQILKAKSYLASSPPNVTRADVVATLPGTGDVVPRRFSQLTTGVLEIASGRLTVSGNKEGTSPVVVDDFFLFEVLGVDGSLLGAAVVSGNGNDVRLAGRSLPRIAPAVPWIGINRGYEYAAGAIDLSSIVPKNKPFRLRTSAFDYAGVALTSDLHVQLKPESIPPVVENPWDPSYCTGAPLTDAQARQFFQPGAGNAVISTGLNAWMRSRHCNTLTGCTDWGTERSYPITRFQSAGGGTGYDVSWDLAVPFSSSVLQLSSTQGYYGVHAIVKRPEGQISFFNKLQYAGVSRGWEANVEAPRFTRNDTIRTGLTDSFLGEHCFKMVFHRVVQGTNPNEREMVIFARY